MTESRIEKFTRISQEMAAAVSEMRADAADVTTHAPETAALVEELSVTCDRWSQWEEVAAVVLAHLTDAGRLARAGGMTLTAEQWAHYQRMAADPRFAELSRDALGVMKWPENPLLPPALFPATEPADEERCDFYAETEQHGYLQCKRRDGHTAHHHIDPPAPGEPAEEETKAEALTDEQLLTLRSIAASSATSKPDGWAWRYWTEDIESLVKGGFIVRDDSFNPDQPRTYGHYRPTLFGEKQVATPTTAKEGEFIDIVFDGPPSHESGRFVEVENPQGASISVGEWIDRGDGFWALRIPYTYSSVVPAPTETEWPSLNDVPPTVRKVKDVQGFQWVRREDNSEWLGCDGSYAVCRIGHPNLSPFVAAREE